jgi:hypothetical protein
LYVNLVCCFISVDIISAIEFDKSGDHLATGDKGGRVVLFERTDVRDVSTTYLNLVFILIFSPNEVALSAECNPERTRETGCSGY